MTPQILIDSSFLYAIADPDDKYRQQAVNFTRFRDHIQVVPDVVLTEVTYLLRKNIHHRAMSRFVQVVAKSELQIQPVTKADLLRAYEIMAAYPESRFDFVDACIMALAEHLNITRICTFDRRDFAIFRPANNVALELLP